ncbi:hypothetical protein [Streptomyces javensis]|uniref:Uncharacterized protein n=1 Tax=Streptomyces javensis TaxID=114698 RepID=A0ABS0R452_9ACTN|nr:hypothetical protein [Streptomyces javensis]MBI0311641.1 hypothetical protein [Streptomyces javensis]
MTTTQSALGDRAAPVAVTPDTVPAGCYWWTDPDGDLCLMPGCMARVQDPEAECTCDKLGARLARAEEKLRTKEAAEQYAGTWWDALTEAVRAHPNANQILADAHRRTGR